MTSPFYPRHITLFTPYFGPWFLVVSPCCFNPSSWQNSWYCWPVYLIFLDHTVDGCEIHRQKDGWNPRNHGNNHQLVQDVWTIHSRSLFLLLKSSSLLLPCPPVRRRVCQLLLAARSTASNRATWAAHWIGLMENLQDSHSLANHWIIRFPWLCKTRSNYYAKLG